MDVSKAFRRGPFYRRCWSLLLQYREQTNVSLASWSDANALGLGTR